jgi:hypothetical protein
VRIGFFPYVQLRGCPDSHFRRVFMRPNWNFDDHRGASLNRDQSKNEQAYLEYERRIAGHTETLEAEIAPTGESQRQCGATLMIIAAVYSGSLSLSDTEICFEGVQANDSHVLSFDRNTAKAVQVRLYRQKWARMWTLIRGSVFSPVTGDPTFSLLTTRRQHSITYHLYDDVFVLFLALFNFWRQ